MCSVLSLAIGDRRPVAAFRCYVVVMLVVVDFFFSVVVGIVFDVLLVCVFVCAHVVRSLLGKVPAYLW